MRWMILLAALRLAGLPAVAAVPAVAAETELELITVSDDDTGFVLSQSGTPFVPWGFNYDHEGDGKLLEDYWDDQWPTVETAFREMKGLGANVVRIHLQFGRFMESPAEPRQSSLDQLGRLVKLAEETGLYLDVTGLGCYHKPDVPPWYDALGEQERWQSQGVFWKAVAKTCAESPAIFCYDLMNEPVVAGGDQKREDWLGPGFGDKHFVQYVTLDRAGRERPEIARQWIHTLVTAIREHDKRHLVTVGLVPWSLDRPGLTSGFVPEKVADELDFLAVHLYPEKGKVEEAIETLKGFAAVGKPVVIEEIFPLKCGAEELGDFIDRSRQYAAGWIGFYWGKTPDELRPAKTISEAITLSWLELFQQKTPQILGNADSQPRYRDAKCEGTYPHHLQGIAVDGEAIYWSFTTTLVKTHLGIQTATFAHDRWWFGCYGDPKILLVTDSDFQMKGRYEFDCSLGIEGLPGGRLMSAQGRCETGTGCTGSVHVAVADAKSGLRIREARKSRDDG